MKSATSKLILDPPSSWEGEGKLMRPKSLKLHELQGRRVSQLTESKRLKKAVRSRREGFTTAPSCIERWELSRFCTIQRLAVAPLRSIIWGKYIACEYFSKILLLVGHYVGESYAFLSRHF